MTERIIILSIIVLIYFLLKKYFLKPASITEDVLSDYWDNIDESLPTIIYFWTEHCSQCLNVQKPLFEKLRESRSNFNLIQINALKERDFATKLNVRTVPSSIIFSVDGKVSFINSGLVSEEKLSKQLEQLMN